MFEKALREAAVRGASGGCEPATIMAAVSATIALASSAIGTGMQLEAEGAASREAARVARRNEMLLSQQRADAKQRGASAASAVEREGRLAYATGEAIVGKGGLKNEGSLFSLLSTSVINAGTDAQRLRANAARAAAGLQNEEEEQRERARRAMRAGELGKIGAGLSGFADTARIGVAGASNVYQTYQANT